jgi:hypothetical protein
MTKDTKRLKEVIDKSDLSLEDKIQIFQILAAAEDLAEAIISRKRPHLQKVPTTAALDTVPETRFRMGETWKTKSGLIGKIVGIKRLAPPNDKTITILVNFLGNILPFTVEGKAQVGNNNTMDLVEKVGG